MYIIRYKTKKGGSGMTNVLTNIEAKVEIIRLFNNKQEARVEKDDTTIGEVYKMDNRWNWYIDTEA